MSTFTKGQIVKYAAMWQAMLALCGWYLNTFGIETTNTLIFGLALLVVLTLSYLKQDAGRKPDSPSAPLEVLESLDKLWRFAQKWSTDNRKDTENLTEHDASEPMEDFKFND